MKKLERARKARGWSIQETARRAGVSWQSLKNLETENGDTRPGDPDKATGATMVALLEVFHPELKLQDFVPGTLLSVVPRSTTAYGRIAKLQE